MNTACASAVRKRGPSGLTLMGSEGLGLPGREVTLQRPSNAPGTGSADKLTGLSDSRRGGGRVGWKMPWMPAGHPDPVSRLRGTVAEYRTRPSNPERTAHLSGDDDEPIAALCPIGGHVASDPVLLRLDDVGWCGA